MTLEVKLSPTPQCHGESASYDLGVRGTFGYVDHRVWYASPLGPGVTALPLAEL